MGAEVKSLSPALQAHLDEGTTTLAWCWRITRADGVTFGFTDHDRTLSFDETDFEPESGLTASEVRSGSDLSVDAQDAEGVLTSDQITETDILDCRWDNAEVEVWRVNWADTGQRVLMRRGAIGQIRRGLRPGLGFAAGLAGEFVEEVVHLLLLGDAPGGRGVGRRELAIGRLAGGEDARRGGGWLWRARDGLPGLGRRRASGGRAGVDGRRGGAGREAGLQRGAAGRGVWRLEIEQQQGQVENQRQGERRGERSRPRGGRRVEHRRDFRPWPGGLGSFLAEVPARL